MSRTAGTPGAAGQAEVAGPEPVVLAGFAALVLTGGINFPAVKATIDELAPLWSAGLRFAAAGLILAAVVGVRRHPLPRGRALAGVLLFGSLSFGAFYACAYWGIQRLPAGLASVVLASAPLVTFAAAVLHRLEPFRWLTLVGGVLALAGIGVMLGGQGSGSLSVVGFVALLVAALCAAEAAVVAKRFPRVSPLVMNAVGMTIGGVLLLGLSFAAGETHAVPSQTATWLGLVYLVLIGSIVLFGAYLFVLQRWTASGASYAFVLFPVVAVAFASLFLGERITWGLIAGGLLVLAGVYVGALLHARKPQPEPAEGPAEAPSVLAAVEDRSRPEMAGVPADCFRCP